MAGNLAGEAGIFFQTAAKALIGNINKWYRTTFSKGGDDLIFLLGGEVCSGGVVAAAMQQHYIACRNSLNISQHAFEINGTGLSVEIAVFGQRHAQIIYDGRVVGPSGI